MHGLHLVVFESHKISEDCGAEFCVQRLAFPVCFRDIDIDTKLSKDWTEDLVVLLGGIRLLFAAVDFSKLLCVNPLTELTPLEGICVERNILINGAVVSQSLVLTERASFILGLRMQSLFNCSQILLCC